MPRRATRSTSTPWPTSSSGRAGWKAWTPTSICVGHTHHPYVLEVGDKLVINPGSVGQPRDGDPRASYAVIEDHRVELKRVEYPVEDTIAAIRAERAVPEPAKELLAEVFRTGSMPAKVASGSGTSQAPSLSV